MAVSRLKYPTFFNISASTGGRASGGSITTSGSYTIHTFTTANSLDWFIVNDSSLQVDILLVGGGGCGGYWGGGGGAGGYISATSVTLTGGKTYPVMVGAGGTPSSVSITPTYYFGGAGQASQFGNYVALGGGGAASHIGSIAINGGSYRITHALMAGGSGGGGAGGEASYCTGQGLNVGGQFGFSGTIQGNLGGRGLYRGESPATSYSGGAGGGGASAAGSNSPGNNGGDGANGLSNSISGSSVTYAGGGGGGSRGGTQGTGGTGGGGSGSYTTTQNTGTPNTGGGEIGRAHV